MTVSVAISAGYGSTSVDAGTSANFVATVTNTNAASVTLNSLQTLETSGGSTVGQPNFMTPNTPVGVGNPVIASGASVSYGFQAVFNSPVSSGPSPQAPGGAAPDQRAQTVDPFFIIRAIGQSSDGSVFSGDFFVPVLSTIAPFPLANGGAFQLGQGVNLINFLTVF